MKNDFNFNGKKQLLILAILLMAALLYNCGYKLSGFGKQIPDHIRTIAIPDFDNKTTRFQADQYLTFAVKEEFIKRSRLKLVESADRADSVLEGEIKKFSVKPLSYSHDVNDTSANLYKITISVGVRFVDLRTNDIIFEDNSISFSDTYDIAGGQEIDDDFFSQETDALLKIAEEFAASVVSTILENF